MNYTFQHVAATDTWVDWKTLEDLWGENYLDLVYLTLPVGFDIDRCLVSLWVVHNYETNDDLPAEPIDIITERLEEARDLLAREPASVQGIMLSGRDRRIIRAYDGANTEEVLTAALLARPWIDKPGVLSASELRKASIDRKALSKPKPKRRYQRLRRRYRAKVKKS